MLGKWQLGLSCSIVATLAVESHLNIGLDELVGICVICTEYSRYKAHYFHTALQRTAQQTVVCTTGTVHRPVTLKAFGRSLAAYIVQGQFSNILDWRCVARTQRGWKPPLAASRPL